MSSITYRAATVADAQALAQLRWAMEEERHPEEARQADREAYLASHRNVTQTEMARGGYHAWLAEEDGAPVACAILIWWTMPPNLEQASRRRGLVTSVYTAPSVRRQGVARRLMELLLAYAREVGIQRLVLWASEMGQPLYEDVGFRPNTGFELNL